MVLPRKFDPGQDASTSGEAGSRDAKAASGARGPQTRPGASASEGRARGVMRPWYRFAHDVVFALGRAFCGLRVSGLEHLPPPPFIVAANHISLFDPPILGCTLPYEVAFMAKVELFQNPLLGPLIRSLNAFPVKRGLPDRDAIDRALATLRAGRALIMFPEGTRDRSALRIREPKFGVGLFAVSAQLPVVPAHMRGTNRFSRALLRAPRFSVTFGPPIMPPPSPPAGDPEARRVAFEAVASAWHRAVEDLRAADEARRH